MTSILFVTGKQNAPDALQCHKCSRMFLSKNALKTHMRIHTGAKPFECPICKECFRTSGHRKNHMTQAHQEQQPEMVKNEQAPLDRIVTENTVVALPTLPSTQSSLSIHASSLRDAIASVSGKSMLGETVRYVF